MPDGIKLKTDFMLSNSNILGAFSDAIAVGLNNELYSESILTYSNLKPENLNQCNIRNTVLNKWCEPMNLQFWRRSAFKSHGGEFEFNEKVFCEDLNFAMWALHQNAFGFLDSKCVAYRCKTWPPSAAHKSNDEVKKMYKDFSFCFSKYSHLHEPYYKAKLKLKALYFDSLADNRMFSAQWAKFRLESYESKTFGKIYILQKKIVNHYTKVVRQIFRAIKNNVSK
jgi:hypothetical protein